MLVIINLCYYCYTRLPSNLWPTTRECAHLVMHGHVTKMAVTPFNLPLPKTPMLQANFMTVSYRTGVIANASSRLWE